MNTTKQSPLHTIFEMQDKLNQRCGVYPDIISKDPEETKKWTLNMLRAYQQELAELMESIPWRWWENTKFDEQNARVELVDMIHFVVSMAINVNLTPEEIFKITKSPKSKREFSEDCFQAMFENQYDYIHQKRYFLTPYEEENITENLLKTNQEIAICISEITDCVPWKWWAKYQETNMEELRKKIAELFQLTIQVGAILNMSPKTIFEAYLEKNKVNHDRQNQGYTEKDEDDCRHI